MKTTQLIKVSDSNKKTAIALAKKQPPSVGDTLTVCVVQGGVGVYTAAIIAIATPKAYKLERMGRSIWLPKAALEIELSPRGAYYAELRSWFRCDRIQDDFLS